MAKATKKAAAPKPENLQPPRESPGKLEAYRAWLANKGKLGTSEMAKLIREAAPTIADGTVSGWMSHWKAGRNLPKDAVAKAKAKPKAKAPAKPKVKPQVEAPAVQA